MKRDFGEAMHQKEEVLKVWNSVYVMSVGMSTTIEFDKQEVNEGNCCK